MSVVWKKDKDRREGKVFAAVSGMELIKYLAAIDIFLQDDLKKRMNKKNGCLAIWML